MVIVRDYAEFFDLNQEESFDCDSVNFVVEFVHEATANNRRT